MLSLTIADIRKKAQRDVEHLRERAKDWYVTKPSMWGLPTGIERLDHLSGGLVMGEMVVLAGGPGSGKTSLAMQAVEESAAHIVREGLDMLNVVISAEMPRYALYLRSACRMAGINSQDLRRGRVTADGLAAFNEALEELYGLPLLIVDGPELTSVDIKMVVEMMRNEGLKVGTLMVDYIQQLFDEGGGANETSRINIIMRNLSSIKMEADCNLLLLSQFSRRKMQEHRPPTLEDLLGSGNIERAADQVWAIHDPLVGAHERAGGKVPKEVHILKNRSGMTGKVDVDYYPQFTQFTNPGDGPIIISSPAKAG